MQLLKDPPKPDPLSPQQKIATYNLMRDRALGNEPQTS